MGFGPLSLIDIDANHPMQSAGVWDTVFDVWYYLWIGSVLYFIKIDDKSTLARIETSRKGHITSMHFSADGELMALAGGNKEVTSTCFYFLISSMFYFLGYCCVFSIVSCACSVL